MSEVLHDKNSFINKIIKKITCAEFKHKCNQNVTINFS